MALVNCKDLINDSLALIDVVAIEFGNAPSKEWSNLAVRQLNGMLGEWSAKGILNPLQTIYELNSTNSKVQSSDYANYITVGFPAWSVVAASNWLRQNDDTLFTCYAGGTGTLQYNPQTVNNTEYTVTFTITNTNATGFCEVHFDNALIYTSTDQGTHTYTAKLTPALNNAQLVFSPNATYAGVVSGIYIGGDVAVNFADIAELQLDQGTMTFNPQKIALSEYFALPVKQSGAIPAFWAWDYQQPMGKIYLYPTVLNNMLIRLVGSKKINLAFDNQSTLEIDDMYINAILYNLACRLYPFLKRETGLDQSIIYLAKASLATLRSKGIAMRTKKVVSPYNNCHRPGSIWTSALNTVSGR